MSTGTDLLLIQPPNVQGSLFNLPGTETPLSLLYLAGYMREKGFRVRVLDLTLGKAGIGGLESHLRAYEPAVVGITSYTTNVLLASRVAATARAVFPHALIVLGGFHASALPERTLREMDDFDAVVYGEGEVTLYELVQAYGDGGARALERVPGVCTRTDGGPRKNPPRPLIEDLDSLPFPARDLIPLGRYIPDPGNFMTLPSTGILFSRGCPYRCTYCSKSVFLDKIRYRSEGHFVEEIEWCIDAFGIRDFRFYDEGPTHSKGRMVRLCEAILERGLAINWNCYSRVDTIDEETLRMMKSAGCYHIKYGIESGVAATLQRIRKPLDLDRAVRVCAMTKRVGIECKANFIIGFPWEGIREMEQTIRYAKRCAPDLATFNLFKPFPGSRLYEELERSGGLLERSWEDYFTTSETKLFATDIEESTYRSVLKKAWLSFYLRPRFVCQRLVRLFRYPRREVLSAWIGIKFLARNMVT